MSFCQVRSGFFVLRECGKEAINMCGGCGKMVCKKHCKREAAGKILCHECQEPRQAEQDDDHHAPGWGRRYRRRYYSHSGHRPYYYGAGHGHHRHHHDGSAGDTGDAGPAEEFADAEQNGFDQNDFESFENGEGGGAEFEEDSSADFLDS